MALLAIGTICENYLFGSGSCVCAQGLSRVQLFATLWTAACQVPLSMGFSRQEYWSELPLPPPGVLPDPGIESTSVSPALAVVKAILSSICRRLPSNWAPGWALEPLVWEMHSVQTHKTVTGWQDSELTLVARFPLLKYVYFWYKQCYISVQCA